MILYISHVFACMWFFAGSNDQLVLDKHGNNVTIRGWVGADGCDLHSR